VDFLRNDDVGGFCAAAKYAGRTSAIQDPGLPVDPVGVCAGSFLSNNQYAGSPAG
jgi:hypothetical protein